MRRLGYTELGRGSGGNLSASLRDGMRDAGSKAGYLL